MNYSARIELVTDEVAGLLRRFAPPRGMAEEAQGEMIRSIAEAINRRLPVTNEEQFRSNIEKTFQNVLDTHDGYAWPTQAEFVKAVPSHVGKSRAPETFKADYGAGYASLMKEGAAVPESAVWGPTATQNVASGAFTQQLLDRYREASVRAYVEAYRSDAAKIMEAKLGFQVRSYFLDGAA